MKKIYSFKFNEYIVVVVFCLVYAFSLNGGQSEPQEKTGSPFPGMGFIKTVAQQTLPSGYKIDTAPVESGVYLQHMITSYNATMKHAIMAWLKKESVHGPAYMKELAYLLGQLDSTKTVKQAVVILTRAISAFEAMKKENPSYQEGNDAWQDKAFSMILLQCSVPLVHVAREQLLLVLDEIHNSLSYWKAQKDAPVKYFFHKSPLKWMTGKRQADEISNNIKKLERLEHDVRVMLGRLVKHIYVFNLMGSIDDSYAWINSLLSILVGVGKSPQKATYEGRFDKTAAKMSFKLSKISDLKNNILSKVSSARRPGYVARNWLKYSAALVAIYVARNFYLQNTQLVEEWVGPEVLKGYVEQAAGYTKENVIEPLQDTVKAIFVGRGGLPNQEPAIKISRDELKKALTELTVPQTPWKIWQEKYGYVKGKPLSEEDKENILAEDLKGNTAPLLQLFFDINKNPQALPSTISPAIQIISAYLFLQGSYSAEALRVVKNLVILSPGIVFAGLGFAGLNKLYQNAIARDYTSIRLALLDINSLFIESATPLNDYNYGKLVYLLQGLKSEAMRYLTAEDMRSDFLADLSKLESNKFDEKQKRGIIKNMFMKYPFLKLGAKSA